MITLTRALLHSFVVDRVYQNAIRNLRRNEALMEKVCEAFPENFDGVVKCDFLHTSLRISVAGTRAELVSAYRKLYAFGFCTEDKAEKNQAEINAYFRLRKDEDVCWNERPQVSIHFTSTVCKRVEVRKETVTIPVYETVCE